MNSLAGAPRRVNTASLVVLALIACAGRGSAAVIHVPADSPTIQGAISMAMDGDQISVAPGTYAENLRFYGKAVELNAELGPAATIIDGAPAADPVLGSAVHFIDAETANTRIQGFTIQGGSGTLRAVVRRGGGVYCEYSSPVIENCWIIDNAADTGGGIAIAGGAPIVRNCRINSNAADAGAGIYLAQNATLTVEHCQITRNRAQRSGGGIEAAQAAVLSVTDTVLRGNEVAAATGRGGGIWMYGAGSITVDGCIIEHCAAGIGGGIAAESVNGIVTRSLISGNSAVFGGGFCITYGAGLRLTLSQVLWNHGQFGAGIFCDNEASPLLISLLIADNSAPVSGGYGGGICCRNGSSPQILSCTLAGNFAPGTGAAIDLAGNANPDISHCIIASNDGGWGIYGHDASCRPVLERNDFWNNDFGSAGGTVSTGPTDVAVDPLFAAGEGGGYYLSHTSAGQDHTSPCIDAGLLPSASVCWPDVAGDACLDTTTTRTDGVEDSAAADLGWHLAQLPLSTPTPTLTTTPPPATSTPLPTTTTAPTIEPTATLVPTFPPEGPRLSMSKPVFSAGDEFLLELEISNPGSARIALVYVALDVLGNYWFWPSWAPFPAYLDWREQTLPAASVTEDIILRFTWPALDNTAAGLFFHAATVDAATMELIGTLASVRWGYQ